MDKPKIKREILDNAPEWLQPLLLKEPFSHTANAPLEVVSNALHTLEVPSTSFFQQRARTVLVEVGADGEQTFTITAKRRARSIYTASAIARGLLVPDSGSTQVIGYTRLTLSGIVGLVVPIFLASYAVFWLVGGITLVNLAMTIVLPFFLMFAIVLGYIYWRFTQMRDDREEIIGALSELIYRELPNKAKRAADA
jgi:hypothetical protein